MFSLASPLPRGDPVRKVAEARVSNQLTGVTGRRVEGREAPAMAGLAEVPVEPRLRATLPPWGSADCVTFRLDIGGHAGRTAPEATPRAAAEACLAELPPDAVWIWTDGSAESAVQCSGTYFPS